MKEYFDSVRNKLVEGLADRSFVVKSENYTGSNLAAILENETEALLLEYVSKDKQFVLSRGEAGCAKDDFVQAEAYLFDTAAGDEMRHTASVANEFLDTLQTKKAAAAGGTYRRQKKDKDSDESSAVFFVNRVATVLPECREPLLMHKNHYGMLLPRHFCEEVVCVAVADAFKKGEKAKMRGFAELVSGMYPTADMDTKSIIMQVLLPVITDEKDIEFVENIVPADFKKAWSCARKYYGKEVKPEKLTAYAKMAKYQGETLTGTRH